MHPLRQVWFGNGCIVVLPTEVGVYVYAPALAGFPGLCNYRIIIDFHNQTLCWRYIAPTPTAGLVLPRITIIMGSRLQ